MDNELPKKKLWTNTGGQQDMADQSQDGLAGQRKMQGNWVVETGWRIPRIEVSGDICLRRPRPTQGHTDDDDDDDDKTLIRICKSLNLKKLYYKNLIR